jgi:Uma2 family endonuclease
MDTNTRFSPTEPRIRLAGVDWATFERLAATSRGARFAFDRGVLEIISIGPLHGLHAARVGEFVRNVTRTLGIPRESLGATTWKRQDAERGIEADQCFHFTREKIAASRTALERGSNDSTDYPVPDLVVEVDISKPQIDRLAIYASIGVSEVWRFVNGEVRIEQLGQDWTYKRSRTSRFLPVRDVDIQRWLVDEDQRDELAWEERLTAWAQGLRKARDTRRPRRKAGE